MALAKYQVDLSKFFPGGDTEGFNKGVAGRTFDGVSASLYTLKGSAQPAFQHPVDKRYRALMTAGMYNDLIKFYDDHMRNVLKEALSASQEAMRAEMQQALAAAKDEMKKEFDAHVKETLGGELGAVKAQLAQALADMDKEKNEREAAMARLDIRIAQSMEVMAAFHESLRAHHAGTRPGSVQCLRPGCAKPSWNGNPDEWCSTGCRNVPPEKKSEYLTQAFAIFTEHMNKMEVVAAAESEARMTRDVRVTAELRGFEVAVHGRSAVARSAHKELKAATDAEDDGLKKLQVLETLVRDGTPGVDTAPARAAYERAKAMAEQRKAALDEETRKDREIITQLPEQEHLLAKMTAMENKIAAKVLEGVKRPLDDRLQYVLQVVAELSASIERL